MSVALTPPWFIDKCLQTAEELAVSIFTLTIQGDVVLLPEMRQESDARTLTIQEVASAVYGSLSGILIDAAHVPESESERVTFFRHNAVHIRSPEKGPIRLGNPFITKIVELFAQTAGADLITMQPQDFLDLIEHFTAFSSRLHAETINRNPAMACRLRRVSDESGDEQDSHVDLDKI